MKKIAKTVSVVLIILIGACFLVACGEKEPTVYGTARCGMELCRFVETETYQMMENYHNYDRMEFSDGIMKIEASILDEKDCTSSIRYVAGHEKDKDGIVVSKWVYCYSILGQEMVSAESGEKMRRGGLGDFVIKEITIKDDSILARTITDERNYIEKYFVNFETYEIKKGTYQGKKLYELTNYAFEHMQALEEEFGEHIGYNPLISGYLSEGSLVIASLAYYGAISVDSIEMTVGTLEVEINGQIKTLPVVGYYETDADKIMSTGIDPNPQSEAYQKVYEQIQHPVFYSVSGDIFNQ